MSDIEAWTDADLAMRIVVLKAISEVVNAEFAVAKALAAKQYPKGASIPARTPNDDVKFGRVTKSDPKPTARITDQAALMEYIRAEYPDSLRRIYGLGDTKEIVSVLRAAGREDLFTEDEVPPDWLLSKLEKEAVRKPIPGIVVHTPGGTVSARVEAAAQDAVRNILGASPVRLLEIEVGK